MNSRAVLHVVVAVCLAVTSFPLLADEPEPSSQLFDGTPKVFVVNGYSTSRQRVIEVRPAIKSK